MKHIFLTCPSALVLFLLFLPLSAAGGASSAVLQENTSPESSSLTDDGRADQPENGAGELGTIADPLEPWNRLMFTFNDRLYFWVMKPLANGYSFFVPEWGRVRVRNMFKNAAMPVRFVGSLLQLKLDAAAVELGRFLVNTTGGIGGMFDVAGKNPGARSRDEDIGQALGYYGIGEGFYIVWPVFGPSSLRDTVGIAGDRMLNPIGYIAPTDASFGTAAALFSLEAVNGVSLRIGDYEDMKESAIDPYVSMRDAYAQQRRSKVRE